MSQVLLDNVLQTTMVKYRFLIRLIWFKVQLLLAKKDSASYKPIYCHTGGLVDNRLPRAPMLKQNRCKK